MFPCEQSVSNQAGPHPLAGKWKAGLTCAFVWSG